MKKYKIWVEIEECDDDLDHYQDVSDFPVCLGEYNSLKEANSAVIDLTGQSTLSAIYNGKDI